MIHLKRLVVGALLIGAMLALGVGLSVYFWKTVLVIVLAGICYIIGYAAESEAQ